MLPAVKPRGARKRPEQGQLHGYDLDASDSHFASSHMFACRESVRSGQDRRTLSTPPMWPLFGIRPAIVFLVKIAPVIGGSETYLGRNHSDRPDPERRPGA
jgi:hypothetical protein